VRSNTALQLVVAAGPTFPGPVPNRTGRSQRSASVRVRDEENNSYLQTTYDSALYDNMHPHTCPPKVARDEMIAATPAQRWDLRRHWQLSNWLVIAEK
jgi:hypothetical protein